MRCKDIMKTHVECVSEADSIQVAARKMRDLNVGFLPVCDRSRHVVGTLTDRDIAIRVCALDRAASETLAVEAMTKEVVACRPDDELGDAEKLMGQHHKSRIMVTDSEGSLAGIISLSDIVDREDARKAIQTMRAVASREIRIW